MFYMHFLSLLATSGKGSGQGSDAGKDPGEELPRDGHLSHTKNHSQLETVREGGSAWKRQG